jgi:hypothetical protein
LNGRRETGEFKKKKTEAAEMPTSKSVTTWIARIDIE